MAARRRSPARRQGPCAARVSQPSCRRQKTGTQASVLPAYAWQFSSRQGA
jgi:hypothetical protein